MSVKGATVKAGTQERRNAEGNYAEMMQEVTIASR